MEIETILKQAEKAFNDKDYIEAFKLYMSLAKKGNAVAQYNIGNYYRGWTGSVISNKKALKWYKKAANQGHVEAQCKVGNIYWFTNNKKALYWFRVAADLGNVDAQYMVGDFYEHGYAVSIDYKMAEFWYIKAAKNEGDSKGTMKRLLGDFYKKIIRDYNQAISWFEKAAEQGNAGAAYAIGEIYEECEGMIDYEKAVEWYKISAKQGNRAAQMVLERMGIKY